MVRWLSLLSGLCCWALPGLDSGPCLSGPVRPLRLVACVMFVKPTFCAAIARRQPPAYDVIATYVPISALPVTVLYLHA